MVHSAVLIREEQPADIPGIREAIEAAFPQPLEAKAVDQLRADGDDVISLVAIEDGKVVGHALFSRMSAPFKALGLGPVAVRPEKQGSGIGSKLVREGLMRAASGAWQAVFVLGAPAYYRRFGFDLAQASGFSSPYAGPHLMVLPLNGMLPVHEGKIGYAPAFAMLD